MSFIERWFARPRILSIDSPKGPWGGGGDGNEGGGGGGPRNPWSVPPGGRKQPQRPTALDEFLRKAKATGGGGGGGNPFANLPGGQNARTLWLIGAGTILLLWILLTSFHSIGQGQRGVVTYFGRYGGTMDPGIRMTFPAPIASVQKVDVQNNRLEDFPEGGGENLVLTGDRNIVDLSYSVRWTIANAEDYLFQIENQQETIRETAEAAMREAVANVTLDQALTSGRAAIETNVQNRMQQILDEYNSGVRIQGVALKQVTPPASISNAFKDVTAAAQDREAALNNARSYQQQKLANAQGAATEFDKVYEEYRQAPEVTRRRLYYETMEQVLKKSDKTVVETGGVVPYLPLDKGRRTVAPEIQAGGAQ